MLGARELNTNPPLGVMRQSHPAIAPAVWKKRSGKYIGSSFIDMEVCGRCGHAVMVIACTEDQETIDRILDHLRQKEQELPIVSITCWVMGVD
jgi:hypothetical protein